MHSTSSTSFPHKPLHKWFLQTQRSFPWRENPSPYAVWVSEVMLQQTRAAVVVPYFLRWMTLFPTLKHLAEAPSEDVLKAWEGLGYYARARNLQEGARQILTRYGGTIPNKKEELEQIKGLGPYTVGAILSFAFHQGEPAVDGNVLRVLSRYFLIKEEITKGTTQKEIRSRTKELLSSEDKPWITSEALIELGATLCQKKPRCTECPLKDSCLGYQTGEAENLPLRPARSPAIRLHRIVAIITSNKQILVKQEKEAKVMAGLHEFPYFTREATKDEPKWLQEKIQETWKLPATFKTSLPEQKHSFTKYRVQLTPFLFSTPHPTPLPNLKWVKCTALNELAFSSGHKRILSSL